VTGPDLTGGRPGAQFTWVGLGDCNNFMIKTACPTTLNLPYSERKIKIEGFGGRPPFGGRPRALGPMPPP